VVRTVPTAGYKAAAAPNRGPLSLMRESRKHAIKVPNVGVITNLETRWPEKVRGKTGFRNRMIV
jgi:hypothetical protein